jgi:cytidine deaminase
MSPNGDPGGVPKAANSASEELAARGVFNRTEKICAAAKTAASHAYAPYSNFRVGAAVEVEDRIFTGANVENATYGATVCAERIALANARLAGMGPVSTLALYFPDVGDDDSIASMVPCGICRQWLAELAPDCVIHICQRNRTFAVSELLPNAFVLEAKNRE